MVRCKHLVSTVLVLAVLQLSCSAPSREAEEEAIRHMIAGVVSAAQRHEAEPIMALATEDLVSNPGVWNRSDTEAILSKGYGLFGHFTIRYLDPFIRIDSEAGTAWVKVSFAMITAGKEPPDLAELAQDPPRWLDEMAKFGNTFRLDLALRKTGGAWKAESATLVGLSASIERLIDEWSKAL